MCLLSSPRKYSCYRIVLKILLRHSVEHYLRSGRLFRHILSQLEQNAALSYEQLVDYQNDRLRQTIQDAYTGVPYFRNQFDRLGLTPYHIQTIEDLEKLPIINKEDLREHQSDLVSTKVRVKYKKYTSGTTGSPVANWRDLYNANFEQACMWRMWRLFGIDFKDRMAYLRSIGFTPIDRVKPPFWLNIPSSKQLYMSANHLNDALIPYFLDKLRDYQPAFIKGVPSSLFRIARFMQLHQETPIPVKAVLSSSETLFPHQREVIERYFGPVGDFYGNSERVGFIAMCEQGSYHYMMDYSIIELIPRGNDTFEIVGTSLHNKTMPLLRYATGDLVTPGVGSCSCGRSFPVIESILGRRDESVITPSGRWLCTHLSVAFYGVPNIIKSQIVQEELDFLRVLIMPTEHFSKDDKRLIMRNLKDKIGDEMDIVVEEVADIPLAKGGKHKFIVSKIPQDQLSGAM